MNIELSQCYYRYHHYITGHEYAVRDINLVIHSSQITGFIGPNGAGKSTLIYLLAGLLKPLKGKVLVDGIDLHKSKACFVNFRKSLAFVSQFPEDQFFTDSVYQEMSFGLQKEGLSEHEIRKRVIECLQELDLDEKTILGRSPCDLGSGERRLVCIAMALARRPKILILDEPTVGLDAVSSFRVWKILRTLSQMSDMTVILVSHELDKLASSSDYLFLMHEGLIIADGSPKEIFSQPQVLSKLGLRKPQLIALAYELKEAGFEHEDWPFFEVATAEAAIKKWLNIS